MKMQTTLRYFAVALMLLFAACPKVERSTGKALDQANEVIDHTSKKLYVEPPAKDAVEDEEEEGGRRSFGEDGSDERYY